MPESTTDTQVNLYVFARYKLKASLDQAAPDPQRVVAPPAPAGARFISREEKL